MRQKIFHLQDSAKCNLKAQTKFDYLKIVKDFG